jgi:SAM-dependent methyltransferase
MPNEHGTGNFEFAALQHAANYRRALLHEFAPWLQGALLEVGAGIGQFSELLAATPGVRSLLAVEPDAQFCAAFRRRLPSQPLLHGTVDHLDSGAAFDAIVSINVLEHIEQDEAELKCYAGLLRDKRGHLCLFVPARQEIYAPLDRDFGHFRRYAKPALADKLRRAGFVIVQLHYFNWIGYFAWWLNFCVLRRRSFDVASVRLFDRVIFPVVHVLETKVARPPFGQSLLAVARSATQA